MATSPQPTSDVSHSVGGHFLGSSASPLTHHESSAFCPGVRPGSPERERGVTSLGRGLLRGRWEAPWRRDRRTSYFLSESVWGQFPRPTAETALHLCPQPRAPVLRDHTTRGLPVLGFAFGGVQAKTGTQ